jgi:predicted RNase H-like nuclease (RuvC/YqgF family)
LQTDFKAFRLRTNDCQYEIENLNEELRAKGKTFEKLNAECEQEEKWKRLEKDGDEPERQIDAVNRTLEDLMKNVDQDMSVTCIIDRSMK